jgi:hypothetical protein
MINWLGSKCKSLFIFTAGIPTKPAVYINELFLFRAFHGSRRKHLYLRELFYFISTIAMKRIIKSKGDGINYLGCDPNGEYHNMREFEGGFFEIVYEI